MIGHMDPCPGNSNLTAHQPPCDLGWEMRTWDQHKYEPTISYPLHTTVMTECMNLTWSLASHAIAFKLIWSWSQPTRSSGIQSLHSIWVLTVKYPYQRRSETGLWWPSYWRSRLIRKDGICYAIEIAWNPKTLPLQMKWSVKEVSILRIMGASQKELPNDLPEDIDSREDGDSGWRRVTSNNATARVPTGDADLTKVFTSDLL